MTSAVVPAADALQSLYERYKSLTLATTAALLLARPVDELASATQTLLRESVRASVPDRELAGAFAACAYAARDLADLLALAAAGEETNDHVERVRASHLALRRLVWDVQGCEYVPCCASGAHTH